MNETKIKITRFEHNEYYIDIIEMDDEFEAWICEKEYGVSLFALGLPKYQPTFQESGLTFASFYEFVEEKLEEFIDEYVEFRDKYFNE